MRKTNDVFSLASRLPAQRAVKAFEVTYMKVQEDS